MATTGSGTSTLATWGTGSYTLAQLVAKWRARLDDTVEPYLWENDELTEYADILQKQICTDLPILEDRTTASVCSVSLVQGNGLIELNPRITKIIQAKIEGETSSLQLLRPTDMDQYYPDWDGASAIQGVPTILVFKGIGANKAFLYPLLSAATGTLKLHVSRLPLVDLDYSSHSGAPLETDKFAHLYTHGIMYQAYTKQDGDAYDVKKAERHLALWERDREKIRTMVLREQAAPECINLHDGIY